MFTHLAITFHTASTLETCFNGKSQIKYKHSNCRMWRTEINSGIRKILQDEGKFIPEIDFLKIMEQNKKLQGRVAHFNSPNSNYEKISICNDSIPSNLLAQTEKSEVRARFRDSVFAS